MIDIFNGPIGSVVGIGILIIGVVVFLKIAKEILGLAIKIGVVVVVVYLLFNYTPLYYYLQGIFSSFGF